MTKPKTVFICSSCGFKSAKWLGRCPECEQWDTMNEELAQGKPARTAGHIRKAVPLQLSKIESLPAPRIKTGITELDRVLSGGLVEGSLTLIAGDPGIGKSTLLLQICQTLKNRKILYVSGEESAAQIKMRAERLNISAENLYILAETNIEAIAGALNSDGFSFLLIDSIQTMQTDAAPQAAGSVTQVRECTSALMKIGKQSGIAVIIVGHATKEGTIAGPKILEHMVDTVLYFEGERYLSYRILRAVKNRFGSVNEMGVFEMKDTGLCEIQNPSEYILSGRTSSLPGSVVTPVMEGTRPLVTEVQALVSATAFPMPKRSAVGIDYNRVMLLVAVLEKRLMLKLGTCDIYVNVAGGIKVTETAADLAVVAAVLSSYRNRPAGTDAAFFGETGLSGEIRPVAHAEKRVTEAFKLGFKKCVIPSENARSLKKYQSEIISVSNVKELFDVL